MFLLYIARELSYNKSMENLNQVIADNIKSLRKKNGLTQAELAEKINYSNKAVSRWETGEVIPDVVTLNNICEVFDIPLASIFEENAAEKRKSELKHIPTIGNRMAISLISISLIWFIATIVYVSVKVTTGATLWQVFIYSVPLSCVLGIIFNALWGNPMTKHILLSILIWSSLASVYFTLIDYRLWIIYIVGIPLQTAVILWANITSNNVQKRKVDKQKE